MDLIGDLNNPDDSLFKRLDAVVNDDVRHGYFAIKHLFDLGHRRILAITVPSGSPYESNQIAGIRKAEKEFGFAPGELQICSSPDYLPECGRKIAYRALCMMPRPNWDWTSRRI